MVGSLPPASVAASAVVNLGQAGERSGGPARTSHRSAQKLAGRSGAADWKKKNTSTSQPSSPNTTTVARWLPRLLRAPIHTAVITAATTTPQAMAANQLWAGAVGALCWWTGLDFW